MVLAGFSITLSDPSLLGLLVHLSKCLLRLHSCGLNSFLPSSIKTMTAGSRADFAFFLVFMINMSLATHMNIFREQFDNEDDEKTQRPIIGECDVGFKRWFVVLSTYCACSYIINRFVAYKFSVWLKIIFLLTGATLLALAKSLYYCYLLLLFFFLTFEEFKTDGTDF